jgi:hypothetical protein
MTFSNRPLSARLLVQQSTARRKGAVSSPLNSDRSGLIAIVRDVGSRQDHRRTVSARVREAWRSPNADWIIGTLRGALTEPSGAQAL